MVRAAKLDSSLYEEVEKDTTATNQALLVVVIASIAAGIGAGIQGHIAVGLTGFVSSLIIGVIGALVSWFIWSFITYFIGTRLFKGPQTQSTYGELLRCIGFSASPKTLEFLVFIPLVGPIIAFLAMLWSLVAMVIAVRQALDFTTGRAIATCIVGFIVMVIIAAVIGGLTAGLIVLTRMG